MWLPILGLLIGLFLGFLTDIKIPVEYSNYLSIAVFAALRYIGWGNQGLSTKYI